MISKGSIYSRKRLVIFTCILALFFLWHVGVAFSGSKKPSKKEAVSAPDFKLDVLDDGSRALRDYRGKIVLLDFWSINCPPCRRAVPHLAILYEKYKSKGFVALGISFDRKDIDGLRAFVEKYSVTYPILLGTMDVARAYGVRSIPTMFLLDKEGNIRLHRIGFNEEIGNEIEEKLKDLLKEK